LTIIYENGDEFWIERVNFTVVTTVLDTPVNSSAVALEKPGFVLSCVNGNQGALGITNGFYFSGIDSGGGNLAYGEFADSIIARGVSLIATGSFNIHCLVFMRGRRLPV